MNSPRSLEACRQLGIIPSELYFQDFDTYVKLNPEVIGLPKEIQKIRFENIDNYRKETIQMVIEQREKIINNQEQKDKNLETTGNIKTNISKIISNETHRNTLANEEIPEEKQIIPTYNLEEQLNNIIEKEKKNLEKLKRRQKNEIEAEIETKIKGEMIRQKSELKEKRIQFLNERLHQNLADMAKKEEQKRIEKEKRREDDLKKKISKQEEQNKKKHEIEQKRLKEIKEQQEKERQDELKKREEEKIKFEKRREAVLNHQREIELENQEKQKRLEQKEKERMQIKENQRS